MFRRLTGFLFLALIAVSANASKYVMCDYCSDSIMTQRAEKASANVSSVIVVDRPRERYFKYVISREVEPESVYTVLQRIPLSVEEETALKKALALYRKIINLNKLDVGNLNIAPAGQPYTDSALGYVGRPIAMRALRNAVNDYVSQTIVLSSLTQATMATISAVLDNISQAIRVEFTDGSSWEFDFTGVVMNYDGIGARVEYELDPASGIDSQGNPIPYSERDLYNFSISGNGPFLQGYADLISRLGLPISGGTQQAECQVAGIRCDRNGCIFIYKCQ